MWLYNWLRLTRPDRIMAQHWKGKLKRKKKAVKNENILEWRREKKNPTKIGNTFSFLISRRWEGAGLEKWEGKQGGEEGGCIQKRWEKQFWSNCWNLKKSGRGNKWERRLKGLLNRRENITKEKNKQNKVETAGWTNVHRVKIVR